MKIVEPLDSNLLLNPPEATGGVDVVPLRVFTEHDQMTGVRLTYSLWDPTEEERLAIMMGCQVMVCVVGNHLPPISVGVAREPNLVTKGYI